MNDIFYFAIMLIVSQTEVKVIYNKVSVAEYQRYETGTSESKSYSNSQDGLMLYLKDKEVFSENNQLNEMFINLAGEKAGFMQALNPKYTKTDVEVFAKSNRGSSIADSVYAGFTQEKMVKNISRK